MDTPTKPDLELDLTVTDLLRILHDLSRSAVKIADWREYLTDLTEATTAELGADRGFLALVNADSGELTIHAVSGDGWTEERRKQRLQIASRSSSGVAWKRAARPPVDRRIGITFHAATTGETYVTGDVVQDPYHSGFFEDVVSEIAVPIRDGGGIILGVINLQSVVPDYFTPGRVMCLDGIANLAATRIVMARYQARQGALVEFGKDLYSITDTPALLRRVVDIAADLLRFEDCSVFMLDRERNEIILQATRGPLIEQIGLAAYPLGEGLTGWVAKHGMSIRTNRPSSDPRWQGRFLELPSEDTGAYLAVPIYGRSNVVGVVRVLRRHSSAPWFRSEFTEDDENVLWTIASQLGSALENIRMLDRLMATERMAAWGEMSARAAHMIGNRTFAIKGDLNELEYLLSDPADKRTEFQGLAESIRSGIFRLEEILQEFRDFVRATQISLSEGDINELLRQCIDESFPKRSKIKLSAEYADSLPPVPLDNPRLKRGLSELIENAISFMPDGGTLTARTTAIDGPTAQQICGLSRSRKYVCIEIADSGPGVPEQQKAKIFTPFYTTRAKGMGLGLSIVKGIVEAHHGCIVETGQPTEGARFTILLPTKSG
jgi:signal transduction histidine kinase